MKQHKKLRERVQSDLEKKGIKTEATRGNDPSGDIRIVNKKDTKKVQKYIKDLNDEYN